MLVEVAVKDVALRAGDASLTVRTEGGLIYQVFPNGRLVVTRQAAGDRYELLEESGNSPTFTKMGPNLVELGMRLTGENPALRLLSPMAEAVPQFATEQELIDWMVLKKTRFVRHFRQNPKQVMVSDRIFDDWVNGPLQSARMFSDRMKDAYFATGSVPGFLGMDWHLSGETGYLLLGDLTDARPGKCRAYPVG